MTAKNSVICRSFWASSFFGKKPTITAPRIGKISKLLSIILIIKGSNSRCYLAKIKGAWDKKGQARKRAINAIPENMEST